MPLEPKPEYLFRPQTLARRVIPPSGTTARLPWGHEVEVDAADAVGKAIATLGIHDLLVCEALARLTPRGATVVDAGANLGQMTSLFAARVGPPGRVIAFEAHPEIARQLARSAESWAAASGAPIDVRATALSSAPGEVRLSIPDDFAGNRGTARVDAEGGAGPELRVPCTTLDAALGDARVAVLKLDVEGHEPAVLEGATALLRERRLEHVVFEDHAPEHSPTVAALRKAGMTLRGLDVGWLRPRLVAPEASGRRRRWQARALLATFAPGAVRAAFRRPGWRALSATP
ncbi:MAG: FkbM family methyltransferase [Myxococcota bacterium]